MPEPASFIGLGETLRNRRRQKELTLERAAQDTRISHRFLKALEEDRWDELPAKVYLEGFLRQYADYLDLEGGELVKKLREFRGAGAPPVIRQAGSPAVEPEGAGKPFRAEALFLVLLAGVLAALYFFSRAQQKGPAAAPGTEAAFEIEGGTSTFSEAGTHRLEVLARESTWARIWADGQVRFEGILSKDARKAWPAETSFRVQAADLASLSAEVDGLPLKLERDNAKELAWSASEKASGGEARETARPAAPPAVSTAAAADLGPDGQPRRRRRPRPAPVLGPLLPGTTGPSLVPPGPPAAE
ncbi:MAG: RodZ domain-containing protein [Elusimicrobiota bacterium]